MKAVVYDRYGSPEVLRLAEVEKPTPSEGEVLVKISAVSLNRSDWEGLVGKPLYARMRGFFKPGQSILGSDIAGWVEAVGPNAGQFKPGDPVFGELVGYQGGFAEYACVREKRLVLKPAGMPFEVASAIPQAAGIALQGICVQGHVQPGQKVLINGAGGGAGMFAIQLAKAGGADVTGVDNEEKLEFMRSLGADHVLDYTREDFTRNGQQYDLILDLIAHRSIFDYQRALKPGGLYFMVGGSAATIFQLLILGPWVKKAAHKNLRLLMVLPSRKDLMAITELYEAGKIVVLIDRRYPLSGVPDALRYLGEGHTKGKVVINME